MVFARTQRGLLTETVLNLNRTPLIERRRDRLKDMARRVREILGCTDAHLRTALLNELLRVESADAAEFAACVRAFIANRDAQLGVQQNEVAVA